MSLPHRYTDLAPWYHLLSAPADYAEEAGDIHQLVIERLPTARTMLELGSGGEIGLAAHVHDRIVDEDRVEARDQPDRAHVAD